MQIKEENWNDTVHQGEQQEQEQEQQQQHLGSDAPTDPSQTHK
jgi:hypothetical protein